MKNLTIKTSRLNVLAICAFVCVFSVSVLATNSDEPVKQEKRLTNLEMRMQKTVCIDVNSVPINIVIRQLAEQVDVDLIMSPTVTGDVTVTLTDVSLEEALQSILDVHGAGYIAGEKIIRILSRSEMPEITERLVTETFQVVHVDVAEVVKALEKFKSAQGSVSYIEGTSFVIVTDTESKIRDITNLMYKIDAVTAQILVEARIYDITSKDNLDIGIDWYAGRRTNWSGGYPTSDDIQVVRGVSTIPTDYRDSLTEPSIMGGFSAGTEITANTTDGYLRFGMLSRHVDIDAQLRAEKEDIDAKLLANPRLLVLDNQQATFDIVTEHPYIERTISSAGITETVKFKNVGVKLVVTPHITSNNMLRLSIVPEFGVVVGQVSISASDVPIVDTRKVDTTAVVRDGQTVVLGGLRKKDTVQQVNKVPLLGDLPLIGNLFKFEGGKTVNNELVVFVTPRILRDPVMSEDEKKAFEITKFNGPKPVDTRAETEGE